MNRRDAIKTLAAGAVAASVPAVMAREGAESPLKGRVLDVTPPKLEPGQFIIGVDYVDQSHRTYQLFVVGPKGELIECGPELA